ncbi:hypothetical protein AMJ87_11920, partial [candidate division WOR_3 bacterium SM23_60]
MNVLFCMLMTVAVNPAIKLNTSWPDSLGVHFVGNWPFGPAHAVAQGDGHVLLGSGGGIYILNIDDPTNPVLLSDTIRTRGFVMNLRIRLWSPPAAELFVGAGKAGIEVWDVLDPSMPEQQCVYNTPGFAYDYDAAGTFRQYNTLVAAGDSGVRVVSTYPQPEELSHYQTPGSARGIRFDGWYAYVADGYSGLRIINFSDPYNPFEVGFYGIDFAQAIDIYWDQTGERYYAYVVDSYGPVTVVNISDQSDPQYAGEYALFGYYPHNVEVDEPYLLISNYYTGLQVASLTPPFHSIGYYDTPGYACDAAYSHYQNCALVADWHRGLRLIDINDPFHEIGHFDVPDRALGVCVDDAYAYIADHRGGLRVIDVSAPAYPREVAHCHTLGPAIGIDVSGTYAYVAAYDSGGLVIVDVATPGNPHVIGHCDTPGKAMDVHAQNSLVYVADDEEGLRIISVTTTTDPYEVGYLDTPGHAVGVVVVDSFAYVADGTGSGIHIIDVSNPSSPLERGSCVTPGAAEDIYVTGSYAYVADGSTGLRVIDIADPDNPHEAGSFDTPSYAYGVYVVDSFCYVADSSALRVINIAVPTNPQEVGYYTTPDCAYDIDVKSAFIYVADGNCGLQIYKNTLIGVTETQHQAINPRFRLCQNPINGDRVTVQLDINYPRNVILDIFSILGQNIETYNLGHLNAGNHNITLPLR